MELSKQGYWRSLPLSPPVDLPNQGVKPVSLASPALAGRSFTTSVTWEDHIPTTHIKQMTNKTYYRELKTSQHSAMTYTGKQFLKSGYMYNWFTLLYSRN